MQTTSFKPETGDRRPVTRDQILEGMAKFDKDYRPYGARDTAKYWFVQEDGKRYPPKVVLSLATGVPRNEFTGGGPVTKILRDLGFEVLHMPEDDEDDEDEPKLEQEAKAVRFTLERDLESALRLTSDNLNKD